jgi:hypothetical protein
MDPCIISLPEVRRLAIRIIRDETHSIQTLPLGELSVSNNSTSDVSLTTNSRIPSVTMGTRNMPWADWIEVCGCSGPSNSSNLCGRANQLNIA